MCDLRTPDWSKMTIVVLNFVFFFSQINLYRSLKDFRGKHLVDNFRPIQPLNGRIVKRSFCRFCSYLEYFRYYKFYKYRIFYWTNRLIIYLSIWPINLPYSWFICGSWPDVYLHFDSTVMSFKNNKTCHEKSFVITLICAEPLDLATCISATDK